MSSTTFQLDFKGVIYGSVSNLIFLVILLKEDESHNPHSFLFVKVYNHREKGGHDYV